MLVFLDFKKITQELDILKVLPLLDIPTKIIKLNADIFSEFFFPKISVKPVFKKKKEKEKKNSPTEAIRRL